MSHLFFGPPPTLPQIRAQATDPYYLVISRNDAEYYGVKHGDTFEGATVLLVDAPGYTR